MAEKELKAARVKVAASKSQLTATVAELKHRLKPATLAGDAWHGVKDKSADYADKGLQAVKERPGATGGAIAAVLLFLLRAPVSHLVSRMFGSGRDDSRVTADLSHTDDDFDLTAPVVAQNKGVKA